jgi:hypothetical protein
VDEMNDYDATGGEQGWTMKSKLNELRLDAGIARIENQKWLCVLDKETGMLIDPMIGLEKFAELIVRECANHCDLLLDHKISSEWSRGTHDCSRAITKHFGIE